MNVIEAARELGKALQADPRYIQYTAAKLANDKDEELQKQIMEFHAKRMDLNTEMGKAEKDTNAITALNNELNALYSQVVSNPKMIAFEAAKAEMDGIRDCTTHLRRKLLYLRRLPLIMKFREAR